MSLVKRLSALPVLAVAVGCQYGPEHLPVLRTQRDNFVRMVQEIEQKHGIPSSFPLSDETRRAIEEGKALAHRVQELKQRNDVLSLELATLEESWFNKLSVEQQIQWRMHRDVLESGAKTEIHQNVEQSFRTQAKPGEPNAGGSKKGIP